MSWARKGKVAGNLGQNAATLQNPEASSIEKTNHSGYPRTDATVETAVLAVLQRRLAQFSARLQPMCGDGLLLSRVGAITRVAPNLRAARQILRQWEGQ